MRLFGHQRQSFDMARKCTRTEALSTIAEVLYGHMKGVKGVSNLASGESSYSTEIRCIAWPKISKISARSDEPVRDAPPHFHSICTVLYLIRSTVSDTAEQ